MQRARGALRVAFADVGGRTRLSDLHESGAAKLRMPHAYGPTAEPIFINTAGGLTGGDRFDVAVAVATGGSVTATTQASEKIYRSIEGPAVVQVQMTVGAAGRLDWLPQETILFDRAQLQRSFVVDLHEQSEFLALEAVIFGRRAMGERVREGALHDRWRIHKGGRLIFADEVRLDGAFETLAQRPASLAGAGAMATLIWIGDDCGRQLDRVRAALGEHGGASAFDGKLVVRLTMADGYQLRSILVPVIAALRGDAPLPTIWRQ